MPTYVYSPKGAGNVARNCDVCCGTFEVVQRMADEALTACPKCGAEIERVICAPNLNGAGRFKKPSEASLAKAGFTQYKKKGKGYYEKSFGSGPSSLNP